MIEEKLKQAITLIRAGKKSEAIPIIKDILKLNRDNENAWLWLSVCADQPEDKKYCLQEALRINPNNEHTKKGLAQLATQSVQQPTLEEMGVIVPPPLPIYNSQNTPPSVNPQTSQVLTSNESNQRISGINGRSIFVILLAIVGISILIGLFLSTPHKTNHCIIVTTSFGGPDREFGYSEIGGEIQNNCGHTVSYIKIRGIVYDNTGTQIGSNWSYADSNVLGNGAKSSFKIIIDNTENTASYTIDVFDWNDE